MTAVALEKYLDQSARWPASGKHILAHHGPEWIVVYQAYRPGIGHHALREQRFGGEFSFSRMTWIKPNFAWMMYRSGWGTKPDQEVTLGLRLRRAAFDDLLARAVASSFGATRGLTHEEWQAAVAASTVRLQWDPDHHPSGTPLERRAIQIGIRGAEFKRVNDSGILEIIDMRPLVDRLRPLVEARRWNELETPRETVYRPDDPRAAAAVGLDAP